MNHKENYNKFYKDFGGAARTKTSRRSPIFGHLIRQLLQALGLKSRRQNLRIYDPPFFSKLPKGFIRLDPWEIEYLYMIASRAKTGILEIGRLRGGSTFVLASANQTVPIYSIDIDPKNDVELRRLFKEHGIGNNVELITGDSQKPLYPGIEKFDVLYIDGDHTFEGCANDIANWYDKLTVGGHMLFHDCFFGCEVQDAVLEFTSKNDTTVVRTPYVGAEYWLNPTGSVAHLIKR